MEWLRARGDLPGPRAHGEVQLQYYRDIGKHPENDICLYCRTKLRNNDRAVVCPQCGQVYHEDMFSQLLCWSSHFENPNKPDRCPNPECRKIAAFDRPC